jgi:pyruvate ferredoxin oxidoreductase gamma subunit
MGGTSFEVRIHGRGGQGVVTAAELLSVAAFLDGHHAQAFPSFGSERMGAPVVAYCRVSSAPVRTRAPVTRPDAVIIQDVTLLHQVDLLGGLVEHGFVLVNTSRSLDELALGAHLGRLDPGAVACVPATELALRVVGRPVPNVPLLGALAALTGIVTLDGVLGAIGERFSGAVAEGNAEAAKEAFAMVAAGKERADASSA